MKAHTIQLADVCEFIRGVTFDKAEVSSCSGKGKTPILRAGNIADQLDIQNDLIWVPNETVDDDQLFRRNDIVICMSSGSPEVVGKTARVSANIHASVGSFCGIIRPKNSDEASFLYFYFRSPAFKRHRDIIARGANIQNLRFSSFEGIELEIPSGYREIAQKLEQVDRLRRLRLYALEMGESFLKATFIELFGDPYASKRSDVACLQDIAIINPAIKPTLDDREELSFVPMSDVDEKNGEIFGVQIRKYGDVKKGYTAFENGDVLFAKITPCMENGKSAIAKNLRNGIGFGSTEWHVLRPTPRTNSEWLLGLIRLDSVRQNAARRFVGSAGQQRVPEDFLLQLMVSVPSSADLERYKRICNRHEALIHTNQEALRQAEHLFQSLLHQAFSEN